MSDPLSILKQAQRAFYAGECETAFRLYDGGRSAHNGDAGIAVQYLRALTEKGMHERGAELVKELLEGFPDNPTCQFFAGKFYFAAKNFQQARLCFELCLQLQPDNRLATEYLLLTKWVAEDDRGAIQDLLRRSMSSNSDFLCDFTTTAELKLIEACNIDSLEVTETEPQEEPEKEISRGEAKRIQKNCRAAYRAFDSGDFETIVRLMDENLAINPTDEFSNSTRGEALFFLGRFAESEPVFKKILAEHEPLEEEQEYPSLLNRIFKKLNHPIGWLALVILSPLLFLLYTFERIHGAIFRRKNQSPMQEELPIIRSLYGYILCRLQRFDEAMEVLELVKPFGPDDFMGYYHRGICLLAMNEFDEGRAELRRSWTEFQYSTRFQCLERLQRELKMLYSEETVSEPAA